MEFETPGRISKLDSILEFRKICQKLILKLTQDPCLRISLTLTLYSFYGYACVELEIKETLKDFCHVFWWQPTIDTFTLKRDFPSVKVFFSLNVYLFADISIFCC